MMPIVRQSWVAMRRNCSGLRRRQEPAPAMKSPVHQLGHFYLAAVLVCALGPLSANAGKRPVRSTPSPANDQDPPPPIAPEVVSHGENGRVVVRAIRLSEPLRVDGRLDETVYQTFPPISDFIQSAPEAGAPASERTDAWVMF